MVEVPLEIDAELPREFEGAVWLAASGLPRRVKIKASKDALKISTAYRADQLLADIVKSTLRGTAQDVQKVQEAVTKFIRTVRERRQNGATLLISSNGRGKIAVLEQQPRLRGAPLSRALRDRRGRSRPGRLGRAGRPAHARPFPPHHRRRGLRRRIAQRAARAGLGQRLGSAQGHRPLRQGGRVGRRGA